MSDLVFQLKRSIQLGPDGVRNFNRTREATVALGRFELETPDEVTP